MARLYPLRTRFQRDVGEIENYFETYSRRHPQVTCMMLRYQPAIGPATDSQVTRYLGLPVVPTYLGFDPRLQFIHVDDGLERSEEHTSELQSRLHLVCRLLLEKKKTNKQQ